MLIYHCFATEVSHSTSKTIAAAAAAATAQSAQTFEQWAEEKIKTRKRLLENCISQKTLDSLPDETVLTNGRFSERVIVLPGGNRATLPVAQCQDDVLEPCFPGKNKQILRDFLACIRTYDGTDVIKGYPYMNNYAFDDAAIEALKNFHQTGSKRVIDLGCGDGLMSLIYLVAGATEIHAFDLWATGEKFLSLLKSILTSKELLKGSVRVITKMDSITKDEIYKARYFPNDICATVYLNLKTDVTQSACTFPKNVDQIWSGRFFHILTSRELENLKSKLYNSLKPEGWIHSVVNGEHCLCLGLGWSPFNKRIFAPHIKELNECIDPIFYGRFHITKVIDEHGDFYIVKISPVTNKNEKDWSLFTQKRLDGLHRYFGFIPRVSMMLDSTTTRTEDYEECFHRYACAQKPTSRMIAYAAEALHIPLSNSAKEDALYLAELTAKASTSTDSKTALTASAQATN